MDKSELMLEIEQKQKELNNLRLQQERAYFRLMLHNLSNKKKFEITREIENMFGIKFKIKRILWMFKEAKCFDHEDTKGFWYIEIDKYGVLYSSMNTYDNQKVKKEVKLLINLAKKYVGSDNHLGISDLKGLQVPEFENTGLNLCLL